MTSDSHGWPWEEGRIVRLRLWLVRHIFCPHVDRFERSTAFYCTTCLRSWPK